MGQEPIGGVLSHRFGKGAAEGFHNVPTSCRPKRDDHVQALSAGCPAKARQLQLIQPFFDLERRGNDLPKGHPFTRIEIKDDAVRLQWIAFGGTPRMELDRGYLGQRDQPLHIIDRQIGLAATFALPDFRGKLTMAALLEELLFALNAIRAADDRERALYPGRAGREGQPRANRRPDLAWKRQAIAGDPDGSIRHRPPTVRSLRGGARHYDRR